MYSLIFFIKLIDHMLTQLIILIFKFIINFAFCVLERK